MNTPNEVVVQRYTLKDLSRLYSISWKTLQKWLKADEKFIGKMTGCFYSANRLRSFSKLRGYPKVLVDLSRKIFNTNSKVC